MHIITGIKVVLLSYLVETYGQFSIGEGRIDKVLRDAESVD